MLRQNFRLLTWWNAAIVALFAWGIFLRVHSVEPLAGVGFDEDVYATYIGQIDKNGLTGYPGLVRLYIQQQQAYPIAILPPTRVTFIVAASAWHGLSGWPEVECARAISCLSSILILLLSFIFAWRLRGRTFAFAVLILMTAAPLEIYMSHRALIDGFFSLINLVVLWSLWEIMQNPARTRWLWFYSLGLVLLVMTKENAAFVYVAVLGLLLVNRWLRFGSVSRGLLISTVVSLVIGILLLVLCAGGPGPLWTTYSLNISKSLVTPYAITTGDGPWFRYLSDLLLTSPAVLIFSIGGAFLLNRSDKAGWYFFLFIAISYLGMANTQYGMNLRYALIWDFPLRFLALIPVFRWADAVGGTSLRRMILILAVGLLALLELANYVKIFVDHAVYDPVPADLLRALDILKD